MNTLSNNIDNRAKKIEQYNTAIEKTKGKLFSLVGYETTGDLAFNKAYFSNGEIITQEIIQKKIDEATQINIKLEEIKTELENDEILNHAQKELIKNRIERNILTNIYHQNAIYIEAEKAGFPLSNKDRMKYSKKVQEINQILFGDGISELPERKQKVINKLHEIYEQNMNLLSNEEKEFFEENIIKRYENTNNGEQKEEEEKKREIWIKEEHIFDIVELALEIEGFDKSKLTKIQMSDSIQGIEKHDGIYFVSTALKEKDMDEYFAKLGIENNLKIVKRVKGNNSVSIVKEETKDTGEVVFKKNYLYIGSPQNGKYNIEKSVLPVILDHEINTHAKTAMGNIYNTNLKDPERGDLEEGIAILNEKMAKGEDLESLYEATIGDIRMFMAENFDDNDLRSLLTIYYKLIKSKDPKIEDGIRRVRMGIPIGEKGARKRDLTYGNSKEIIKELETLSKTEEGIQKLNKYAKVIYSTEIGYEGLEHIDEILEGIKDINDLEPDFPIFAGKILYRKLFKGKLDKDKMLESDVRSIIETNKTITFQQKKLLIRILHLIKENTIE